MNLNQKSDVTPAGYHVLVEMVEVSEKSTGGIILNSNDTKREQAAMPVGRVIEFGPLCFKNHESGINSPEEWGVKVGDHVLYASHNYMRLPGDRETNKLIQIIDMDIKAKVNIDALKREGAL